MEITVLTDSANKIITFNYTAPYDEICPIS